MPQFKFSVLWRTLRDSAAQIGLVGTAIGIIFMASMQWNNVQVAMNEIPGLIAWKDSTSRELSRMAQEIHDMHDNGVKVK